MFQPYHADSRDRSRDSGNGSRTHDLRCFSTIMPPLVTDLVTQKTAAELTIFNVSALSLPTLVTALVTPEMGPELMIFTVSALSCQLS